MAEKDTVDCPYCGPVSDHAGACPSGTRGCPLWGVSPAPRKHSREWFAAKVKEAADRIDTYPEHIKAGMVWATATLPTLPAAQAERERGE